MKIVQLSDLHVGGLFKEDAFEIIVKEVNWLSPDVIIISGDLTDDGLIFQFQHARSLIHRLNCPNLIALPGNHDYRHTGYLLFKKFFPFSKPVYEFKNLVILTLGTARPDRDEGEVGHRQNVWLEDILNKYEKKTKIVVIHHHLIAIPDTGYAWRGWYVENMPWIKGRSGFVWSQASTMVMELGDIEDSLRRYCHFVEIQRSIWRHIQYNQHTRWENTDWHKSGRWKKNGAVRHCKEIWTLSE